MKAGEEVGQGGAGRCVLLGVDCVEEATHCMLCAPAYFTAVWDTEVSVLHVGCVHLVTPQAVD